MTTNVSKRGRPRKYYTEEEKSIANLKRCQEYRTSKNGKEWFENYRKEHREERQGYDRLRYVFKKYMQLYDALHL
jgi:hypothetical protein